MQRLKINVQPNFTIAFLVCCSALAISTESSAEVELMPDQQDVIKEELLVTQADKCTSTDKTFEVFLSVGYRKDKLNWNEASENGSVNIMSELKWENLNIVQLSATAKLYFYFDWSLHAKLNYGSINSGSNQDSDYNGNNRTLEFSRSNNKGGGDVGDASLGLGRTIRLFNNVGENFLAVTPLFGLSIHQQNLTMTDGYQTLTTTGTGLGPFYGLNNSYDAQWQGPWVGIETLLQTGGNWSLSATAEYHWADYTAQANWNLRPLSFTHTAQGQGLLLAVGASYLVSKDTSVNFSVNSQQWHTGAGTDRTVDSSNGSVTWYPLNAVNWESTAFNVGMSHFF